MFWFLRVGASWRGPIARWLVERICFDDVAYSIHRRGWRLVPKEAAELSDLPPKLSRFFQTGWWPFEDA